MNSDDLKDWQLCWHANLLFYKRITNPQKCIVCSETHNYSDDTQRSTFWVDATRCSAGHRQTRATPDLGVCATCDRMYMYDVVKGKHTCRREGCRRILRVHEFSIREKLESDKVLLDNFLSLLQKYRVYECAIHCDEVAYDNPFLALKPPTSKCDHDRNVCDTCLKAAFESAIRGGRLHDLVCPDSECKKPVSLDTIRSNISVDIFKVYNKQLALITISKHENFRWCTCGHGQIHGPGESNPEWNCLSCSKRHCYICKEDSSISCEHLVAIDAQKRTQILDKKKSAIRVFSESAKNAEAAQHRAREDISGTNRKIAETTKKCPKKGCPNKIERKSGCGHFTCAMCRTEFCWCCKAIWKSGVAQHVVGCRIGTKSQVEKNKLDLSDYKPGWDSDEGYNLSLDKGLWLLTSHM